jgi:hypothetical protein
MAKRFINGSRQIMDNRNKKRKLKTPNTLWAFE